MLSSPRRGSGKARRMLATASLVAALTAATFAATMSTNSPVAHADTVEATSPTARTATVILNAPALQAATVLAAKPEMPYLKLYRVGTATPISWGHSVSFVGSAMHAKDHRPIGSLPTYFQELRAGNHWVTIQTRTLNAEGNVIFRVVPSRTTTYRMFFPPYKPAGRPQVYTSNTELPLTVKVLSVPSPSRSTGTGTATATTIGQQIVNEAAKYNGAPYVYGAAGPNSFDCSGLTMTVFRKFGVYLPHQANAQKSYGRPISQSLKQPGDLMIFVDSSGYGYHAAIYAGGGRMWDTANPQEDMGLHTIWSPSYVVRRLIG